VKASDIDCVHDNVTVCLSVERRDGYDDVRDLLAGRRGL